jgi:signal transduction histidine kinase
VNIEVRRRQYAEVMVRDRGIGIAADRQREVFERFQRLDSAQARHAAGVGLGLPMSRDLAALNGGSLTLEHSEPGRGSAFVLRLPVRDS